MAATIQTIEKPTKARALDTSGNNNHGQIYSGRALEFDGVTDYLDCGTTFSHTSHAICVWAKITADSNNKHLFGARDANNDGILLFYNDDEEICYYVNNTDIETTIPGQFDNTWVRIVATSDGSTQYLYINGVLHTSQSISETVATTTNVKIGARNFSGVESYFNGALSDLQAWNTHFTADDVTYDYLNPEQLALNRGGTSLTESNLKLWYPMNDGHRGQQSYILDASNIGLGDDIITNGGFDSDTGWTKGTGWSISGGQAHCDGSQTGNSSFNQDTSRIAGQTYKLTYTISNYVAGNVNAHLGGNNVGNQSGNGDYVHYLVAGSDNDDINMYANSDFNATIDNLVIKPVNQKNHATTVFHGDELITNGTMEADSNWADYNSVNANVRSTTQAHSGTYSRKFTVDGSSQGIQSDTFTTVTGRTYLLSFEIYPDDATTARIAIRRGDNSDWADDTAFSGLTQDAWNTKTVTYTETAGGSGAYLVVHGHGNTSGDFYVDDVSIKEVGTASGWTDADQQLDIPQTALQSYNQLAWFDGTGDYVTISDHNDFSFGDGTNDSAFSVSAWIYMNDATSFSIMNKDSGGHREWNFITDTDDKLYFRLWDNSTGKKRGRKYNTALTSYEGQWIHVAGTYNGNESDPMGGINLYFNGEAVDDANDTNTGTYTAMENKDGSLQIGVIANGGKYANGAITEVSIWETELSQTEVNELYNDGKALDATTHSESSNIKGYWRNNGLATWTNLDNPGTHDASTQSLTETMLITAGADATRDSQGFLMNRQKFVNSLNTNEESYTSVDINHTFGTADFSYGFWFKLEDTENGYLAGVQSIGNSTGVGLTIDAGDGKIRSRPFGVTAVYTSAAYDDGEWHYAHHNIDRSANAILYIDGTTAVLTQDISGVTGNSLSTNSWNIGAESGTSNFLAGEIDDFVVYSDILTTAEITRNYNAGKRSHR